MMTGENATSRSLGGIFSSDAETEKMPRIRLDEAANVWEIVRNAVYLVRNTGWIGVVLLTLMAIREGIQYAGPPLIGAFVTATETNKMLVPLLKDRIEGIEENKKSINSINENLKNMTTVMGQVHEDLQSLRKGQQ